MFDSQLCALKALSVQDLTRKRYDFSLKDIFLTFVSLK